MSLPKISHPLFDAIIPSNSQKVKLRPMLVREEKILLMAKQSESNTDIFNAIYQVVNNCIQDTKTKIEKLTLFDIEYLYLKIRAFSVNNVAKQRYKDTEDDKTYEFEVDLNGIEIIFPEGPEKAIKINDKLTILMQYPPASLYADKMILRDKDHLDDNLMLACIDKIYEGDKVYNVKDADKKEYADFLENLPIPVSNKMKDFINNLPSFKHEFKYTNGNGTERIIKLTSVIDFFIF